MARSKPDNLQVRVAPEVLERLDRLAAMLNERTPGLDLNRSDVARVCVVTGIAAEEEKLKATPKP